MAERIVHRFVIVLRYDRFALTVSIETYKKFFSTSFNLKQERPSSGEMEEDQVDLYRDMTVRANLSHLNSKNLDLQKIIWQESKQNPHKIFYLLTVGPQTFVPVKSPNIKD